MFSEFSVFYVFRVFPKKKKKTLEQIVFFVFSLFSLFIRVRKQTSPNFFLSINFCKSRTVSSDVASDLVIQINNITYLLHKV